MITSKHASVIVLAGLLGVVLTQQGCGSDDSGPSSSATAGASGAATGAAGAAVGGAGAGSSGAPAGTAGAPSAGAPGAGAPAVGGGGAGGTTGTAAAGAGTTAGAGGSTAGAGGTAGGGTAGAGGASPTFAAVKTLFSTSCGTGNCHNKNSGQLDYQGTTDLHALLTTPIPATGSAHCNGTTLAVPNDAASSFLVTVVTGPGQVTCKKNGTNEMIGRMPDDCSTTSTNPRACFTAAQIKTITDWIAAGAPN